MKTVILALFVLMAISHDDALECYCAGTYKICPKPTETCYGSNQVCASVIISAGSRPSYFKSCMGRFDCMKLNMPGISSASCCSHADLCNR